MTFVAQTVTAFSSSCPPLFSSPWTSETINAATKKTFVTVTSPSFDGLPLLDQHKLVNAALAEPLRDGTIHELRIKTKGTTT